MKILIDIGHPAQVHYFKHFTRLMEDKGNSVLFTCRDKDVTIDLLENYNLIYISIGKNYKNLFGKIWGLFWFSLRILEIGIKFKPNFLINGTFYSAIVAKILKKPHISLEDTFNKESTKLYMPFTNAVLTGNFPHPSLGEKEIRYQGYQELLYLHPNHFSPDISILKDLGVQKGEKYFILRFVSWQASHDFGHKGLNINQKHEIIKLLNKHGKVFISSENDLKEEFSKYHFPLPPSKMHDALAFAEFYIGEGATMASECAMLGTPAIYINPLEAGSIDDQENYGLVHHLRDGKDAIGKILELLSEKDLKEKANKAKINLLSKKIDVTSFLLWFVENWPKSFQIMRSHPEYQDNFK